MIRIEVFSAITLIQILNPNDDSPNFVWEPQKVFRPTPQNFDQSCILLVKCYPESFRRFYLEMAEIF
jgi:hypothetical protein